jgi:hypothetical protein
MKAQLLIIPAAIFVTTASFNSSVITKPETTVVKQRTLLSTDFAFFRTHRECKGIEAVWAVTNTNGVVGFSVQRTYEDPNDPYAFWEEVSYMSCTAGRFYKCNDESVFPGIINYRIVAFMIDGNTVSSDISSVRIVRHK